MRKENPSSFDSFMWGGSHSSNEQSEDTKSSESTNKEEQQADWMSLAKEVQQTWKAVSPLVQPIVNKFKK
ncbi:hypothetical protein [Halobacillus hunanensis]|uniref:hypothetical protein n=1 Tax=Halobacillus hunanensis TaxID=578214 RepID=UPI0009A7B763|nr:hypothetical protein [Halobacillus hunanensis]